MTNSTPAPRRQIWQVPQCPYQIDYDVETMQRIGREVSDGFRALPYGGLEVGGLLLGTVENRNVVRITGHEPVACAHANGPSFLLTDEEKLAMLARVKYYAEQDGSKKVVGWYHSHTRSALSMTPEDMAIHYKLFPEAWHVALVLQPVGSGGVKGGFFFREAGGAAIRTSASYKEFTVEAAGGADPLLGRPMAVRRSFGESAGGGTAAATARTPSTEVARTNSITPVTAPRTHTATAPLSRSRWPVWAALALMFVLAIGAVVYLRNYYAPKQKPAAAGFLKVEAFNKAGNLMIAWDPKTLGSAKQGQLDIQDGSIQARLVLDERTLMTGSVSYAYKSDVTGYHLRVEKVDGTVMEGSTTYVAPNGPERAAAKTVEEAPKVEEEKTVVEKTVEPPTVELTKAEKAALAKAEKAEKLKADLAKKEAAAKVETPALVRAATSTGTPAGSSADRNRPVEVAAVPQSTPPPTPVQAQQPAQQAVPSNPAVAPAQQQAQVAQVTAIQTPASNTAVTPALKPAAPAAQRPAPPPPMQLAGRWVLTPGSQSRSPATPESVVITAHDKDGSVSGNVTAKYRGGKQQNFAFSGRMTNGMARFPFTAKDGSKGEIEFIRVPGISDMAEVVWYGADVNQAYDHIIRRVN